MVFYNPISSLPNLLLDNAKKGSDLLTPPVNSADPLTLKKGSDPLTDKQILKKTKLTADSGFYNQHSLTCPESHVDT